MGDEFEEFLRTRKQPVNVDHQRQAIEQGASQLGINPVDYATAMSYETGGTFDPPVTRPDHRRRDTFTDRVGKDRDDPMPTAGDIRQGRMSSGRRTVLPTDDRENRPERERHTRRGRSRRRGEDRGGPVRH